MRSVPSGFGSAMHPVSRRHRDATQAAPRATSVSPGDEVVVHESAYVDEGAVIGPGTRVWHFCHVMSGARIGGECSLGQNVVVMSGAVVGDRVKIQNNVSIYDGVILEDDVFCGPSCVFTNVSTPRASVSRKTEYETTRVGRGCTIGANATVVCGVTLGAHAFVGAGAVVTADVPPHALVMGVPARRVGWMCECGERLHFESADIQCERCGRVYREGAAGISIIDPSAGAR